MKAFKYFDLNDNGAVEPDEFAKAIEKIGIQIPTQKVSSLEMNTCNRFGVLGLPRHLTTLFDIFFLKYIFN